MRNLLAGGFCVASTALYGILSLPLAVAFLGKEELGLWNLVTQTTGYLLWLDLGVAGMAGRTLAEPFHRGEQQGIDSAWSSLQALLCSQAAIVVAVGLALLPFFQRFFQIPPSLADDAAFLFIGTLLLSAASLPLRAAAGVFLCQNRFHWASITQGVVPWFNLLVFWLLLETGHGVRSFVAALAAVTLLQWIWIGRLLSRGAQPPRFRPRLVRSNEIRRTLSFSSSMILWGIAPVALAGLPAVVLGRQMGLDQVSIYHVTSRIPVMLASLAGRTYHAFYPALQKAFVAGERSRFRHLFRFSTCLAAWVTGACLLAACLGNRHLVAWLAEPDFYGGTSLTLWICIGLFVMAFAEQAGTLFHCSGKPRLVSPVLALEIAATAAAAFLLSPRLGPVGIAVALALTPLLIRLPYFTIHGPRSCGFRIAELCGPAALAATSMTLGAAGIALAMMTTWPHFVPALLGLLALVFGAFSVRKGLESFRNIRPTLG
jgi:O-antigen/teichoic acid export membrane protein